MPVLTEWVSVAGLAKAHELVAELKGGTTKTRQVTQRIRFLEEYLRAIDQTYGPVCVGPNAIPARPLRCVYSQVRKGRLYCQTRNGPKWDDGNPSYICAQGMPSALRPLLMGEWGRDIDIENCHVVLMHQLGKYYHMWPEHNGKVPPLVLPMLEKLATERDVFFKHVADVHMLEEPIKEQVKPLFLRILYGGTYDTWLRERQMYFATRSPWVTRLEQEIRVLQRAVLSSVRFAYIVEAENQNQRRKGKTDVEAVRRGAFSKVAQHLENEVLEAMHEYLRADGWSVLSLIFDGLILQDAPGKTLDLEAMADFVERAVQFRVRLVEKPLLGTTVTRAADLL